MRTRVLVYCAGVHWDSVKGTDRHLVERLADRVGILWVDPPRSMVERVPGARRRLRPSLPALQEVAPSVMRLSVTGPPFPSRWGLRTLTEAMMRVSIRNALRRMASDAWAMVVSSPEPRFGAVPGAVHVYFATDDFAAGADLLGLSPRRLKWAQGVQVEGADLVVAVTPTILGRLSLGETSALVLPNGCDTEHFRDVDHAQLPADVALPGPVAGVVGQLSSRLDLDLLAAVSDAGVSVLLVGPATSDLDQEAFPRLLERPNVLWVGEKRFDELPSYMRVIDVGLTPYVESSFNKASFPLKTLEYLSAGRPVVSTPLPAVEWLNTSHIRVARGPEAFAAAVRRCADESRDESLKDARRTFAAGHSWESRADLLLTALRRLDGSRA